MAIPKPRLTWRQELHDWILGENRFPDNFEEVMDELLGTLKECEAEILRMRFEQALTLEQIAERTQVTRERVRQILVSAQEKLQHPSRLRRIYRKPQEPDMERLDVERLLRRARENERRQCQQLLREQEEALRASWQDERQIYRAILARHGLLPVVPDAPWRPLMAPTAGSVLLETLVLSKRLRTCLARDGVTDLCEIYYADPERVFQIRNLGEGSMKELVGQLLSLYGGVSDEWNEFLRSNPGCDPREPDDH